MNTVCPHCSSSTPASGPRCVNCGEALPAHALVVGSRLAQGRFSVGRVLGQGGFGLTYQGADAVLKRVVAIKELFPEGSSRAGLRVMPPLGLGQTGFAEARAGVLEEGRMLAQFDHPGVVRVLDAFEENGTVYLVMEKLEGITLGARLQELGRLEPAEVERIAVSVSEALAVVHAAGLLHRDIKPDNVFLTHNRVVLIDFGSARGFVMAKTVRHTRLLTPGYAPLEQYAEQARFGPYTDLYALGATLYHALQGFPPPAVTDRMLGAALEPLPARVPPGLREAIEHALALQVDKRPKSVAEFTGMARSVLRLGLHPNLRDFSGFVGQERVKQELLERVRAAKSSGRPLESVLLLGPHDSGRRTLAQLLASELGVGIQIRSAAALRTPGDLFELLKNFREGDLLLVEDLHRLGQTISERLVSALRHGRMQLIHGRGVDMHWVQAEVPRFTLIGSSHAGTALHPSLTQVFPTVMRLDYYLPQEIALLLERHAQSLGALLSSEAALEVAVRSRGEVRTSRQLLKRVMDFALVAGKRDVDVELASNTLDVLGLDQLGLEHEERHLLEKLMLEFGGGPAALSTLAAAISRDVPYVRDVLEPYLLHLGLIEPTAQGWVLRDAAYYHLRRSSYDAISLDL